MFERFTDRARRVLVYAQDEAKLLEHNYIGTEHILLGLVAEGEAEGGSEGAEGGSLGGSERAEGGSEGSQGGSEGIAAEALAAFGITLPAARQKVAETVGPATHSERGSPPFTPRSKKVLELSLREALTLGHNYIGTEHILLGLVREGEGVAAQVMVALGADLGSIRQRVLELIAATAPPTGTRRPWPRTRGPLGGSIGTRSPSGPAPEASPRCRCGADLAEAARYRTFEVLAATGQPDQTPLKANVVYCRHCGFVLRNA
jgi:ATP-dependent Clp protease ATP-binding subunit ClpA